MIKLFALKKKYQLLVVAILFMSNIFAQPTRTWGTYYGGFGNDLGFSVTVDKSGNVYVAGHTGSTTAIGTPGSHQPSYGGGTLDVFLVKFNSVGVHQWATYYGGVGQEVEGNVIVDTNGNIYLSGYTSSINNISTSGGHQPTYGGGAYDAFLVKFNSEGTRQWATYYGGISSDYGNAINVEQNGNVYLAGRTSSTTSISTVGCHQQIFGGFEDAFLVKFNSEGVRQWATYYGGADATSESGSSVALDPSGNVYLAGYTGSNSAISTPGSHQEIFGGEMWDGFLVKFDSIGVRLWATYYGGAEKDFGNSVSVDALSGNIYLAGYTFSTNDISTIGSHQPTHGGSIYDAFLVKFNSAGVRQWATYYGGDGMDYGNSIATDGNENIYLAGTTSSVAAISTVGSHQTTSGGNEDAFLVKFDNGGVRQWGSYYGGTLDDYGLSLAIAVSGHAYLAGYTKSSNAISTPGSHKPTYGGGSNDAFLVQFDTCSTSPTPPSSISGLMTVCNGTGNIYSISAIPGASNYTWTLPAGWSGASTTNSISATAGPTSGTISVTATNACGTSAAETLFVNVNDVPAIPSLISGDTNFCETITAHTYSVINDAAATSYTWTLPSGWVGTSTINSINVSTNNISGNITVTANNGCGSSAVQSLNVIIDIFPTLGSISGPLTICSGSTNVYSVPSIGGSTGYLWTLPGGWSGISTTNNISTTASSTSGNITVTATNACGTSAASIFAITVNDIPALPSIITGEDNFCEDITAQIYSVVNDTSATSYTWTLPSGWVGTSTTNIINTTTGSAGGNITVIANNTCGSSPTQTISVIVNPLPSVSLLLSIDTICNYNSPIILSGQSPTGGTFSGTAITGGNFDPNAAGAGTHVITYTFTDANSCTNTATDNIVVDLCLGINELENNSVSIYPNPFTNTITIISRMTNQNIRIFNSLGSVVYNSILLTDKTEIDLSNKNRGIYFIQVGTYSEKIIKE